MTRLLEKAVEAISALPDEEQDALATLILDEMTSDRKWDDLFAASQDQLAKLAEEALAERREGRIQLLDPDSL